MALTDQLVSYYKLDEASGTRNDSVGGLHLTDNNSVSSGTGKQGNAASFVAASLQYLERADNATHSVGDTTFHIAGWYKPTTVVGAMGLVTKAAGGSNVQSEFAIQTNGVDLLFYITDGTNTKQAMKSSALSAGTWVWFDCYYNTATDEIGIATNGGAFTTTATVAVVPLDGTRAFRIGAFADGFYANGLIDEVGFWKGRVLTAGERTQLYNSGSGLAYPFTSSRNLLLLGVG